MFDCWKGDGWLLQFEGVEEGSGVVRGMMNERIMIRVYVCTSCINEPIMFLMFSQG